MKTMKKFDLKEKGNKLLKDQMKRESWGRTCPFLSYEPVNPITNQLKKKCSP